MQHRVSHQVSGAILSSLIDWVLYALGKNTRVIFKLNMTFGQELVVLLTSPSVFSMFLAHAWR
jgi:hypothetical protein